VFIHHKAWCSSTTRGTGSGIVILDPMFFRVENLGGLQKLLIFLGSFIHVRTYT
jgi:hypothetical protein